MTNRVLDARYELAERIGSGGMAEVYRAWDLKRRQTVAVKLMRADKQEQQQYVRLFEQEARIMRRLRHPNIVEFIDEGTDGDEQFIVMELVEGESLKTILERRGNLQPQEGLEIAAILAGALAFAHNRGVVHCDVKPHNVIVSPDGTIKLVDFGVARAGLFRLINESTALVGSLHYLAPEQIQEQAATPATDIYALGVTLYEMVYGQVPFPADTLRESLAKRERGPDFAAIPNLKPSIVAIMERCLRENPQARHASMHEMAGDLTYAKTHDDANFVRRRSRRINWGGRKIKRVEERPRKGLWRVLAIVTALVVLGAGGGWLLHRKNAANQDSPTVVVNVNVVGQPLTKAMEMARERGVVLHEVERVYSDVQEDYIISQSPTLAESSHIEVGAALSVVVSAGPQPVTVPNLTGMTEQQARDALVAVGMQLGEVTPIADAIHRKGTIVGQSPEHGQQGYGGDVIDVTVVAE